MTAKPPTGEKLIASNKKAFHDYFILQKLEVGLALTGTEVKSLRDGKVNLKDSYILFKDDEAFLFGTHISPYTHGNIQNHDPERTRKLLLHRRELEKFRSATVEKGLSVVPLRLYFRGSRVKAEIAVVRGKKQYDKRETERKREADRETAAAIKQAK
jgi:SsrA-binding protein